MLCPLEESLFKLVDEMCFPKSHQNRDRDCEFDEIFKHPIQNAEKRKIGKQ